MASPRTGKGEPSPSLAGVAAVRDYPALVAAIAQAHNQAQRQAVQAVNLALTLRNWLIGYYIVEYEQHGSDRAQYGERLLDSLSLDLRKRLGRGFGRRNLFMFREFYRRYPIVQSLIAQFGISLPSPSSVSLTRLDWQDDAYFARLFREITWTHFIELVRMDDPLKRAFYEVETLRNHWSVRELIRQINSLLYERVGLSRDKEGVLALAKQGELITTPAEMVRDPYVFEFLGLKREELYNESLSAPPAGGRGAGSVRAAGAKRSGGLRGKHSMAERGLLPYDFPSSGLLRSGRLSAIFSSSARSISPTRRKVSESRTRRTAEPCGASATKQFWP